MGLAAAPPHLSSPKDPLQAITLAKRDFRHCCQRNRGVLSVHMATDITSAPLAVRPRSPAKASVVEDLSERTLLLPSLLGRALAANDEAKHLLSLLQAARAHGEDPSQPWSSLRQGDCWPGASTRPSMQPWRAPERPPRVCT